MKKQKHHSILEVRRATNLNQTKFWGMVGVTQSAGSRYETGRTIPKPVATLVELVHVQNFGDACNSLAELRGSPTP